MSTIDYYNWRYATKEFNSDVDNLDDFLRTENYLKSKKLN